MAYGYRQGMLGADTSMMADQAPMPMAGTQSGASAAGGAGAAAAASGNPYLAAALVGASFLSQYMENKRRQQAEANQMQAAAAQNRFGNESKGLDTLLGVYSKGLLK